MRCQLLWRLCSISMLPRLLLCSRQSCAPGRGEGSACEYGAGGSGGPCPPPGTRGLGSATAVRGSLGGGAARRGCAVSRRGLVPGHPRLWPLPPGCPKQRDRRQRCKAGQSLEVRARGPCEAGSGCGVCSWLRAGRCSRPMPGVCDAERQAPVMRSVCAFLAGPVLRGLRELLSPLGVISLAGFAYPRSLSCSENGSGLIASLQFAALRSWLPRSGGIC